ncbi:MAG TPA: putative toxin-antitoxin system toxin component, PIN family [Candidatus Brocadiaceae bacterium]
MRKIRAVLDTNVVVSGIISPKGAARNILDLARKDVFKVVTSVSINHEILNVLHRDYIYVKYNLTEEIVDDISAFLYEGTILTEDLYLLSKVKKDPDDDKFLACAVEGEADYIVSGDEHLLDFKCYMNIQILDARSFLKFLKT